VKALAPITDKQLENTDLFVRRNPSLDVTRYAIPEFETRPYLPTTDAFRDLEGNQIKERLPTLIETFSPDGIFIGRETFAWHVPDIALAYELPSVMRIAGATTLGLLRKNYPEESIRLLLQQFRKVDRIYAPARHLVTALQQMGIPGVDHIPNALDLNQFSPGAKDVGLLRKLGAQDDEIIIGYVANLHSRKRPLDLVSAAELALKRNPKLLILVVGDGPLRQSMELACREKRILERFRFTGWIDYSLVPEYIKIADVLVMPSDGEGLARVYLETQACGRVLLASDIPPAREVITDGETGILFPLGDIRTLSDKIQLVADSPDMAAQIGGKARERVMSHSIEAATKAYEFALHGLISEHQTRI
jgi:glycosyltransferase involved in cell wall biosynthesis